MSLIDDLPNWSEMSKKQQLLILRQEAARRRSTRLFERFYPDTGPFRRDLYAKHLEFFRSGAKYRERCAICANRVGKTLGMGGYETTCHLTGEYPAWWEGRRFEGPVYWWMAGKTNQTTRDILQLKMLGPVVYEGNRKTVAGTGLIPGDLISRVTWSRNFDDLVDTIRVKHVSGGFSVLGVKSYQQGRSSFEGTEQHGIWLDEEPPADIYGECVIRTMTTRGIVIITFTPLEGMSKVVLSFMPKEMRPADT